MTDLNKRFCELAELYGDPREDPPDYANDPIAVLRVMREREDWHKFANYLVYAGWDKDNEEVYAVQVELLLTPGAMLEAAIRFLEEHHE